MLVTWTHELSLGDYICTVAPLTLWCAISVPYILVLSSWVPLASSLSSPTSQAYGLNKSSRDMTVKFEFRLEPGRLWRANFVLWLAQDEKKLNFGINVEAYLLHDSVMEWVELPCSLGWNFDFINSLLRYSLSCQYVPDISLRAWLITTHE